MGAFKARGLALRETNVGEADRLVTLLLKGRGKLTVSARGARKVKSKYLAAARPFCYADYTVYAGAGFNTLASADVIDNFFGVAEDYEKLCAGAYFLELAEKTVMEDMPCDDLLYLLLVTLKTLEKGTRPAEFIRCVFEIKFMQLCGYAPATEACAECGAEDGLIFFGAYGAVCGRCAKEHGAAQASAGLLKAVGYILESDIKNVYMFNTDDNTAAELKRAAKTLFNAHSDARLKSERFLR